MQIKYSLIGFLACIALSQNILVAFANSGDFVDVAPTHPNYTSVMYFKNMGILEGYADGSFRPNQTVSRVEVAEAVGTGGFSDIDATAWYVKYVIYAVKSGIVQGFPNHTFWPNQNVTLVENLKMLLKAQNVDLSQTIVTENPYEDAFNNLWYSQNVQYAKNKNLINADGQNKIYPNDGISRAQLVEILYRLTFSNKTPPPAISLLPTPSSTSGLSIKVEGNHFIDANSKTVRLHGVNRSGQEFMCIQGGTANSRGWGLFDGPTDLASAQAIASWHANTVRIPLNEDCWLGINGVNPKWGGVAYQNGIKAYVDTLHQAGLYVILDLHWNAPGNIPAAAQQPLPDADHAIDFWKSVATTFGTDQAVIFDLYNEPFLYGSYTQNPKQDLWDCWLNGCALNQYLTGGQPYTKPYAWNAVGMQTLVNTVRATGATNVIIVGGLEWANDLTGWAAHKPNDPLNSIAAAWHSYPEQTCSNKACWDKVIAPLAAKVPIVIGEVGDNICKSANYIPTLLAWANEHKLSYLGWTWNTWSDCAYVLIKDYAGTPTANYGQAFHDFLFLNNP